MRFTTVYYSNFWYSRHYRLPASDFGGTLVSDEETLHKFQLRILSVFFDLIYIPRTHLITQSFDFQHRIPDALIRSEEFKYLMERGVLRISTSPGLDAKQDTERIVRRAPFTKRVIYPKDKKFLSRIPITEPIVADTSKEAKSNTQSFRDYGELLLWRNKEIGSKFIEAIKSSQIPDVPFFHEEFINKIRQEFGQPDFDKIWRETNSIYLTSPDQELRGLVAFFNEDIESVNYRFKPYSIDRYLYSPTSLYTFLCLFLNSDEIRKLISYPIEKTHSPIIESNLDSIRNLRREYQEIVTSVSVHTQAESLRSQLGQQAVRAYFELALDGKFDSGATVAANVLEDIAKISKIGDISTGGIIGALGSAGVRYGAGWLKDMNRRRRYPAIHGAIKEIKGNLRTLAKE